ncbi:ATP-binding cassette domain-containing protein [Nonomuraea phyllanthi]|uniref:ATP-binding cassette domain-containing protein n=1 Tax=Nonomuraea phyllanthi TaxID=2219224 RepID=A0A5C4VIC5_9ACTN|nr:ATP-binding cassette domain-containing protein [Nonomuraea phyllanthi]KAB8188990.1 ATP-binding cassette domain-containing protein [Nonomuraea phyllanthi]QFY09555.1 ATP-binding cassette domain-containing protein [Nonomuraea phyllanthi]
MNVEVRGLTKTFGPASAVTDLSFEARAGIVTGFLGPNGAGKTTTMRMMLGLVAPTSGTATFGGRRYADLSHPSASVGAVLDSAGFHPAHTARDHLRVYARMGRYGPARVEQVADLTGVSAFADRLTRTLSTGMRQRLSLATALLGDPQVLLLDEPSNGLDPQGIAWLRHFVRELAAAGRTILVSSHVLGEIENTADHVVVIRDGRLVTTGPITGLYATATVLARSPQADLFAAKLGQSGIRVERRQPDLLRVHRLSTAEVAAAAASHGVMLHEITPERPTLEQAFLDLTGGSG